MQANEYQSLAWATAKPFYKCRTTDNGTFVNLQLATAVLALAGKSGELANKVKKMIEGGEYLDHNFNEIFTEELGGIQWYVAATAKLLGITLEDLMGQNIGKLRERYAKGMPNNNFSTKGK